MKTWTFAKSTTVKMNHSTCISFLYIIRLIIIYLVAWECHIACVYWTIEMKRAWKWEEKQTKERQQWIRKCMEIIKWNRRIQRNTNYILNCILTLTCFDLNCFAFKPAYQIVYILKCTRMLVVTIVWLPNDTILCYRERKLKLH